MATRNAANVDHIAHANGLDISQGNFMSATCHIAKPVRADGRQVAHIWAQGAHMRGKNSNGQFWFEGRTLYSYGTHYVAGYLLAPQLALINADKNSITTAKHVSYARSAVRHDFLVPGLTELAQFIHRREANRVELALSSAKYADLPSRTVAAILAYVGSQKKVDAIAKAAARAKAAQEAKEEKAAREQARRDCAKWAALTPAGMADANSQYNGKFYSAIRRLESNGKALRRAIKVAKEAGWAARERRLREGLHIVTSQLKTAREKDRIELRNSSTRALIRRFRVMCDKGESLPAPNGHSWCNTREATARLLNNPRTSRAIRPVAEYYLRAWLDHANAVAREEQERRERKQQEAMAQELAAWKAGGHSRGLYRLRATYLRARNVERDDAGQITGGVLETSRGASVPLVHAIRAFAFVRAVVRRGEAWQANGKTIAVGHFSVSRIDADGTMTAGCHTIRLAQMEELEQSLGLRVEAAAI